MVKLPLSYTHVNSKFWPEAVIAHRVYEMNIEVILKRWIVNYANPTKKELSATDRAKANQLIDDLTDALSTPREFRQWIT